MGSKYGKIGKKLTHQRCRRCGRRSYNLRKGYCAACGYGASKRLKGNRWKRKNVQRLRIR